MADIRELIILSPTLLDPRAETPGRRWLGDLRMALRRAVVKSSRLPLVQALYAAAYRAHLWMAATLGRRFRGTRAVYLTSGMSTGDVRVGISDVDVAFFGEWPESRQFLLMKIFGALAMLSPLFDQRSLGSICRVEEIEPLCATDMFMALNHAKGKRQWKLLAGDDVLSALPEIAPERFSGCVYMDVRRWWSSLATITFGDDLMARDSIFRNSVCFKAAAETLRSERMLHHGIDLTRRGALLAQALEEAPDPTLAWLHASAQRGFLDRDHDPRPATMRWFLQHAEQMHVAIRGLPSFAPQGEAVVLGAASELALGPGTMEHARAVVEAAAQQEGLQAAYLVPAVAMMATDSLALLLDPGPSGWGAEQMQRLHALHAAQGRQRAQRSANPQRLLLFVLLQQAAYQLDAGGSLDFFHYTLFPEANPDVFAALAQPGSVLHGAPRPLQRAPAWSAFAQELAEEELNARRGAYARFGVSSRPTAMENLRNLWRFLQLLVLEETGRTGRVEIPVTLAAVRRCSLERWPGLGEPLLALEAAHGAALRGEFVDERELAALLREVYTTTTPQRAAA